MKQPSATLIGAFVLGALALVVAAILFFGSGALFTPRFTAVSYFRGSVAGLQTGALVTYRGVRVGQVKSVGIRIDPDPTQSIVQVTMEFVPEAVKHYGSAVGTEEALPALVERGLTAQLVMQSFVTGQLQVELDFRPQVKALKLGGTSDVPEIPTVPSPFQALTEQLQTVDIAAAVATFQRTLASLDALLTNPALKQTIDGLPALVADVRQTVKTIEREVQGFSSTGQHAISESAASLQSTLASVQKLSENLDREAASTLAAVRGTLQNADTAVDDINVLLDPRGQTMTQVQDAVEDLAATAARLRDLSERVDRDPGILIRGRKR
jgi:paraquat-inducible protein B